VHSQSIPVVSERAIPALRRRATLSLVPATTAKAEPRARTAQLAQLAAPARRIVNERAPLVFAQRLVDPALVAMLVPASCWIFDVSFGQPYQLVAALTCLAGLLRFNQVGLYRSYGTTGVTASATRIGAAWLWIVVVLGAVGLVTGSLTSLSAEIVLTWAAATPIVLTLAHTGGQSALRALHARGVGIRTAVVAGGGPVAFDFVRHLRDTPSSGIRVEGFFEDHTLSDRLCGLPVLGSLAELAAYVKAQRIDHVYVALSADDHTAPALLEELCDTTASVSVLPGVVLHGGQALDVDDVAGVPVFTWSDTPFVDCGRRAIKRASDLVLAGVGLLLAAPVMAFVAVAVKLTSPGPILFRQRRHGEDGKEIVVYKFRTMTVMEDGAAVAQAQRNDPRVTRLGRILRKTSLDELPQLFNVLQGRMSVIGPRPHALAHNEQYRRLITSYMRRHKVKPGLSGWAQVHGCRGETKTVDDMRARIEHDLYYLRNWSLWLDLRIVLKTLKVLVHDPKAF
jgi:putative colanic acid biosysnthesis UDP-glucose lipid carrier transferase